MSNVSPLFKTLGCVLSAADTDGDDVQAIELPVSEHYNAVCDGTFVSVLGLNHPQLVDDAVAEKAATSPRLH